MDIEEDEQIGGPVALVLAIVALKLTRPGRHRRPHLADELDRALVEADHWAARIRRFGIEVEHVFYAGDLFGVDLRNAPHVLAQWLQTAFGQAPTDGFPRDAGMFGAANQFTGQEFERPGVKLPARAA
jgi:hypothetical protein